jgi:FkbM family methyltransferase
VDLLSKLSKYKFKVYNSHRFRIVNKSSFNKLKKGQTSQTPIQNVTRNITSNMTFISRLENMKKIGFDPRWIVDGGALMGKWTKEVHQLYPEANFIVVEPNPEVKDSIRDALSHINSSQINLFQVALGENDAELELNVWADARHSNSTTQLAASSLKSHVQGPGSRKHKVKVKSIDDLVAENNLGCDLLKLDLQGAEKEALNGAKECLKKAEVVVCEFGLLEAYVDRTTPYDLIAILNEYDFTLYDIVDLRYRPYDGAMAGGDFIFVKKGSKLKAYKDYH